MRETYNSFFWDFMAVAQTIIDVNPVDSQKAVVGIHDAIYGDVKFIAWSYLIEKRESK